MKIGSHKIEDLPTVREQDIYDKTHTIEMILDIRWVEDGRILDKRVLCSTPNGDVIVWMTVR